MTGRQSKILQKLNQRYISSAAAVSSAQLGQDLECSAATIRYDLISLEKDGYVTKNHVSAGRVPTKAGLKIYALSHLPPQPLGASTSTELKQLFKSVGHQERLVPQLASKLSGYPAIFRVAHQPLGSTLVQEFHVSLVSEHELLVLAVLHGGQVYQSKVSLQVAPKPQHLEEIAARLLDHKTSTSLLVQEVVGAVRQSQLVSQLSTGSQEFREGIGLLLNQPESNVTEFLKKALELFEQPQNQPLTPVGMINVRVGEGDFSWVHAGLKWGNQSAELSLFGPTRMRYPEVFSVAHTLAQTFRTL